MVFKTKKINIFIRFDVGGLNGFGHASRCIELAKHLSEKAKVNICTNQNVKKFFSTSNLKFIYKKKSESENNFLLRISKIKNKKILFIDKNYNYKSNILKLIEPNFSKIVFYQNFSKGIQKNNIIINPIPNLNDSINIEKRFRFNKIFNGTKYLLFPNNNKYKKKNYLGISFGGSDPKKLSIKIINLLKKINWDKKTIIFIGAAFKFKTELKKIPLPSNIKLKNFDTNSFFSSFLTISSPGVTSFELIYNKIFSLYVSCTSKHSSLGNYLEKNFKYGKNFGIFFKINHKNFKRALYYYWKKKYYFKNKFNKYTLSNNSCKNVLKIILNEKKK